MSQPHQHHHHDHTHGEEEDPYYRDQMCLVTLSALFGAVCLALYFWRGDILKLMLGEQFHPFVLASGIVLLILAGLRACVLWIQVGKEPAIPHTHGHGPAPSPMPLPHHEENAELLQVGIAPHVHSHAAGETCQHDHPPGHVHTHSHAHGHDGHDHSWAPWRYVVLLIPIILFFLGIPSTPPSVQAGSNEIDTTKEAASYTACIGMSSFSFAPVPLEELAFLAALRNRRTGPVLDFKTLEASGATAEQRDTWAGKIVRVKGQFVPERNSRGSRVFSLGRFRIQCCRMDAVQLNVPIFSDEAISHVKDNDWIMVTGEIRYFKDKQSGLYRTMLHVHGKEDVAPTSADQNPYIGTPQ